MGSWRVIRCLAWGHWALRQALRIRKQRHSAIASWRPNVTAPQSVGQSVAISRVIQQMLWQLHANQHGGAAATGTACRD